MRGKSNVIKRNVEKVWGAHYTLGARYLQKNTVFYVLKHFNTRSTVLNFDDFLGISPLHTISMYYYISSFLLSEQLM
jgi:hypothetical protein